MDASSECIESIRTVLSHEAQAVAALLDVAEAQADALARACRLLTERCGSGRPGRLVATGVGKAGLIAQKLAATFASTGTPAFFLHPTEARHGDLGMVTAEDVVLALSNSGASEELLAILPSLSHIGATVIALVGRADSPLARAAGIVLAIGHVVEACPLGLAPSASTTAMLALGDALALTVQRLRRFTPEQYALFHPGGALGRRLMTCKMAMRPLERVATVTPQTSVIDCMRATSRVRAGSAVLIDDRGHLLGIFTDGDLRRVLARQADATAVLHGPVSAVATSPCLAVHEEELLPAALRLCNERHINELPVVTQAQRLVGLLDLQDLVHRGFSVADGP